MMSVGRFSSDKSNDAPSNKGSLMFAKSLGRITAKSLRKKSVKKAASVSSPTSPIRKVSVKGGTRFVFADPKKNGEDWLKDRLAPAKSEGIKTTDKKAGPREIGRFNSDEWTPAEFDELKNKSNENQITGKRNSSMVKGFAIADINKDGKDWLKDRLPAAPRTSLPASEKKAGPRDIGRLGSDEWTPAQFEERQDSDRTRWLDEKFAKASSRVESKRGSVGKKAGPREIGRVLSDEWTPAEFADFVKDTMNNEDRTSWLNPRLSATASKKQAPGPTKAQRKKAGPREIGRVLSDEWTPAEFADMVSDAMKNEDRTSWLNPRLSATASKKSAAPVKVAKKAGPREIGRVLSEEWTPAEFADMVSEAMKNEDRTSWLKPRVNIERISAASKRASVTRKAGPREVGRVNSDEWQPAVYEEALKELTAERTSWLQPRLSAAVSKKNKKSAAPAKVTKKAGPREIGRVGSDEWKPAFYPEAVEELNEVDRLNWLKPRLSTKSSRSSTASVRPRHSARSSVTSVASASSYRPRLSAASSVTSVASVTVLKKAGPREIGRVGSDEWKPAYYPEVADETSDDRTTWLKPRLSVKSSTSSKSAGRVERKAGPRDIGRLGSDEWTPAEFAKEVAAALKSEDRNSWLEPRMSVGSTKSAPGGVGRGSSRVTRKAGPRDIGRLGSDEWTPAEFAQKVAAAMKEEDRTSWLNPRLSASSSKSGAGSKRGSTRGVAKKAGPREIGRTGSNEWTPAEFAANVMKTMKAEDRTSWLKPRHARSLSASLSGAKSAGKRGGSKKSSASKHRRGGSADSKLRGSVARKPGPREIGRVGSDEWQPADFAQKVTVAMKIENRNRTSWLNPKLATIKEKPAARKSGRTSKRGPLVSLIPDDE